MRRKGLLAYEAAGVPAVLLMGAALHFAFGLSGGAAWSVLVGKANESIWEHVKIFAMPYMIWACILLARLRPPLRHFVTAKIFGLYIFIAAQTLLFGIYTSMISAPQFGTELLLTFCSLCLSGIVSCTLFRAFKKIDSLFYVTLFLLALFIAMYLCFTAMPPEIALFKDPSTGLFGITK